MLHAFRLPGVRVLRIAVAESGKLGVPFLDWRISPQSKRYRDGVNADLAGSGLYGVCFRGRLVYVGSYCGQKPKVGDKDGAYFTGDVVGKRWWAHFGSLVARSHRLHIAPRVLRNLSDEIGPHPLLTALSQAGPAIHKDDGCLGAENRIRFAVRNWTRFTTNSASDLLRQFSFVYVREDGADLDASPRALADAIEAAEIEAIAVMHPEVNTAQRARAAASPRISPRKALSDLERILSSHLQRFRRQTI